jgi:hypothetical protein
MPSILFTVPISVEEVSTITDREPSQLFIVHNRVLSAYVQKIFRLSRSLWHASRPDGAALESERVIPVPDLKAIVR